MRSILVRLTRQSSRRLSSAAPASTVAPHAMTKRSVSSMSMNHYNAKHANTNTKTNTNTNSIARHFCARNNDNHNTVKKKNDASQQNDDHATDHKHFLSDMISGNRLWLTEHNTSLDSSLDDSLKTQSPISTALSCCDSRVPTSALGSTAPNLIFSVRNLGNQFSSSIGSFRYGLEVLETPHALIMGHTNCGAIRAAASDYRPLHTMVQQEIISLVRVIRFADSLHNAAYIHDCTFDDRCNIYSEINVDWQIARLMDDYQISHKVQNEKLTVVGLMFDVHNAYEHGYGKIHIVNINGDRDIQSIQQHPLLAKLENEDKETSVARLFAYSDKNMHKH